MKLLVATDLSARSEQALDRAVAIATDAGAELKILHVIDDSVPASARKVVAMAAETDILADIARVAMRQNASPAIQIAEGNVYKMILSAAEETGCDLIVLGRHRIESCDAAFGGTTMGRVVRMGRRPVLVVADRPAGAYRRVVVGMDFSEHARQALGMALAIAPGAAFHLVHAFGVPFGGLLPGEATVREICTERQRELGALIDDETAAPSVPRRKGREIAGIARQGDVEGVLRQEINRIRPDLLVLGTHGRGVVAEAILGSVAQDFLNQPPCDLLIVRHTGEER
ncbi:MAG: universal stress protein [Alphaproteobacteria bacterium]